MNHSIQNTTLKNSTFELYFNYLYHKDMNFTSNEAGLKALSVDLNLSMSCISRVVKDYPDISYETKCRVIEKLIDYKYVPLDVRKSISNRNQKSIGVVVDSMVSPFFGMVTEKLIKYLNKFNYRVVIFPIGKNIVESDTINEIINSKVDGFISFLLLDKLSELRCALFRMPGVVFGRYQPSKYLNCVYMDDYMGGELAALYLITKSSKKYLYVGNSNIECNERRLNGFKDKLLHFGINDLKVIDSRELDKQLPQLIDDGYTSIFAFDDSLANIICKKCNTNIDIVGFNGTSTFYVSYFKYPSIYADYDKMIKKSCDVILNDIINYTEEPASIKFNTKMEG